MNKQRDSYSVAVSSIYKFLSQLGHADRYRQTFSHPPAPVLATGADVAAAPPSAGAAEASAAGAGVAKASESTEVKMGVSHLPGRGEMVLNSIEKT